MARRKVVSVSVSVDYNPDARVVVDALKKLEIPIGRAGGQILAWAAAHLTAPVMRAPAYNPITPPDVEGEETFGMTAEQMSDLLDDF